MLKVSKNGQITLPKEIRDRLQIIEGGLLEAEVTADGILLRPVEIVRKKMSVADIINGAEEALSKGDYTDIGLENLEGFLNDL